MRLEINCGGCHVPAHHHMIVDNHGVLVDLSAVRGGALDNPDVVKLEWDDALPRVDPRYAPGHMTVRPAGAVDVARAPFWDYGQIEPYLQAYHQRRDEIQAASAFDPRAEAEAQAEREAAERAEFERLKAKFEPENADVDRPQG